MSLLQRNNTSKQNKTSPVKYEMVLYYGKNPNYNFSALTAEGAHNLITGIGAPHYVTVKIPEDNKEYWEMLFQQIVRKARAKEHRVTFKGSLNQEAEDIMIELGYNVWHLSAPPGSGMLLNSVTDSIAKKPYISIGWPFK